MGLVFGIQSTSISLLQFPFLRVARLHELADKSHHTTEATAVTSAEHAELGLDDELHDRHGGAVDSFLLVTGARAAGGLEASEREDDVRGVHVEV